MHFRIIVAQRDKQRRLEMRFRTKKVSDDVLRKFIKHRLGTAEVSISHLVDCIRQDAGYSFPTRHSPAMDEFERLGFKLRSDRNKYGSLLRTYVYDGSRIVSEVKKFIDGKPSEFIGQPDHSRGHSDKHDL